MIEYGHEIINASLFLLALFFIYFLINRYKLSNHQVSSKMKIEAMMAMGAKEKIAIIDVFDKKILIGITPNTITTLHIEENKSAS